VRIQQEGGKSSDPFYAIVHTRGGLRILGEIDLFGSENNSREFLNAAALERLKKSTSPEAAAEFQGLFAQYQADLKKAGEVIEQP